MSSEELDDFSNSVTNDQRVSSRQKIYIGLTQAGSDRFSVFFAGALFGIRVGLGILPLAFLVLAFIALYFYPLHGRKLKQVKMNLNNLHSKRKV